MASGVVEEFAAEEVGDVRADKVTATQTMSCDHASMTSFVALGAEGRLHQYDIDPKDIDASPNCDPRPESRGGSCTYYHASERRNTAAYDRPA
jgi:hypothetical protein